MIEPGGKRIEHRETIHAPAARVWDILTDMAAWPQWNPLNPAGSGTLAPGETIEITVVLPGMKPQPARPVILAVEPGASLRYATTSAGGMMRAHRYFVIEALDSSRCTIANGEIFAGPVGRLVALLMGAKIRDGMAGMNHALKARAEA